MKYVNGKKSYEKPGKKLAKTRESPHKLSPKNRTTSSNRCKSIIERHNRFIAEYLKDLNATQAYYRAGYNPKSRKCAEIAACRLLGNVRVAVDIERKQAERAKRCEITADAVLKKLWAIASVNIKDVAKWTYNGTLCEITLRIKGSDDLTETEVEAIKTLKETTSKDGCRRIELVMYDKILALELVARHLGMLNPKPTPVDPREEAAKWRQMIREMDDATLVSPATTG